MEINKWSCNTMGSVFFTLYGKIPPPVCLLQNNIGIRINSPHVGSLTRQDGQKEVLHDSDNTMSPLNILVTQPVLPDNSIECSTHGTDLLWTRRQDLNQHHLLLPLLSTQTHMSKYSLIMFRFRLLHPSQMVIWIIRSFLTLAFFLCLLSLICL